MYKVQYMNYKTKEIAEEEFKHPKYALARYLTISSFRQSGLVAILKTLIFSLYK